MADGNGSNGNGRRLGKALATADEKLRASQAWTSIFRPGSVYRRGYTDSPRNRSYVIMNNVLYHLHRVKVVQHVVHDHVGAVPGTVGVTPAVHGAGPEDGRPRLRRTELLVRGGQRLPQAPPVPVAAVPVSHPLAPCLEPHPVRVAVTVGARVRVALGHVGRDLHEDDHAGRAAVDAQGAARAHVFVDDERDVVRRVLTRLHGTFRRVDGVDRDHVNALPRADVDASLAQDALRLVDVEELLGLDRRCEVRGVDLLEVVVGHEVGHRRVRVCSRHGLYALLLTGRPKREVRTVALTTAPSAAAGGGVSRLCHFDHSTRLAPTATT